MHVLCAEMNDNEMHDKDGNNKETSDLENGDDKVERKKVTKDFFSLR